MLLYVDEKKIIMKFYYLFFNSFQIIFYRNYRPPPEMYFVTFLYSIGLFIPESHLGSTPVVKHFGQCVLPFFFLLFVLASLQKGQFEKCQGTLGLTWSLLQWTYDQFVAWAAKDLI